MKRLLLALVLSGLVAAAQEPSLRETSIYHVTVINVVTGTEVQNQTVTVQGDRIVSIAPTQEKDSAQPGAVDAHGGFLIPGLWDMHVHVHDKDELPLYVANGVTGVRVMSGEKDTAALRAELARQTPSPEIYLASAIVDGNPPIWPGSIVVKKAADARRTVDEIKASGADFIKVYSRVPRDAYFALADEAKQQHTLRGACSGFDYCPGGLCRGSALYGASAGHRICLLKQARIPDGRFESGAVFS